jgi:carboxyl-terminal processing protease
VPFEKQSGDVAFEKAGLVRLSRQRSDTNQGFKDIAQNVQRMKINRETTIETLELKTFRQRQLDLFSAAETFNKKKSVALRIAVSEPTPLAGNDNQSKTRKGLEPEKQKEWHKTLQQDIYLDEAMNVLGDMLAGKGK